LVEKINGFSGKIDGLGLDSLTGPAQKASQGLIGQFLNSVNGLLDKLPAPLKAIVEPAIQQLVEKLNPFKG